MFSFFIEKEESYRRRADPSSTVVILWKDLFCLFLSLVCACIRSSPFDKSVRNHNAQPHYSTTLARWIELYRAAAMKEGPTWHRQTKNMKRIYSGEEVIFPGNMSGLAPPSSVTAEKFNVTRLLRQTLYTIHTRPCCRLCGTGGDFFIIKLLIARLSLSLQLCRAHISLSLSSHTHTQIFGPGCVAQLVYRPRLILGALSFLHGRRCVALYSVEISVLAYIVYMDISKCMTNCFSTGELLFS